jgi:protein-disulfide isomerase
MPSETKPIETPSLRKRSTKKTTEVVDPMVEPVLDPIAPDPVIKPEETFTFKATHFYAVLVVLAFAVGILIGYLAWGRTPPAAAVAVEQPAAAAPAAATTSPQYVRYKIPTDGYPSLGPANAPITLVEFADFQCPYCREWEQQTYKPLLDAYPGKIRIVYRDFPLTSIHPNAMPAAEAAQCANEQGKFWDFHDKLFSSENLSEDVYKQYAQDLGLDVAKFTDCLTTHKYAKQIQADSDFAANLGINSTPTFFVNGLALIGAQPLNAFTSVIDKELAGQIPK